MPAGGRIVRAWDLAGTEAAKGRDPDWTAGQSGRTPDNRIVIADVLRLRGGPDEIEAAIKNTAASDGRGVTIGLPQDPGQAGKWAAQYLTRGLAGHTVSVSPESGDKVTRASPAASQLNVGNVSLLKGPWNRPLIEELRDFPAGRHDDQVDALSRAFGMLTAALRPMRRVQLPLMGR